MCGSPRDDLEGRMDPPLCDKIEGNPVAPGLDVVADVDEVSV